MGDIAYLNSEVADRAYLARHLECIAQEVRAGKVDHVTAIYLHSDGEISFTREGYVRHGDHVMRLVGTCHYHAGKLLELMNNNGLTKFVAEGKRNGKAIHQNRRKSKGKEEQIKKPSCTKTEPPNSGDNEPEET